MGRVSMIAWLVCSAACSNDTCEVPDHTTYSCEPLPAGSDGCTGGPVWLDDGTEHQDDVDKVFPADCTASVPMCSSYYRNMLRLFECHRGDMTYVWSEAL